MISLFVVNQEFDIGRVVTTMGVSENMNDDPRFSQFVQASLQRHVKRDWGDLDDEDKETNNRALREGDRVLSAYEHPEFKKIWIITEYDRSVTTVLFPEEY